MVLMARFVVGVLRFPDMVWLGSLSRSGVCSALFQIKVKLFSNNVITNLQLIILSPMIP